MYAARAQIAARRAPAAPPGQRERPGERKASSSARLEQGQRRPVAQVEGAVPPNRYEDQQSHQQQRAGTERFACGRSARCKRAILDGEMMGRRRRLTTALPLAPLLLLGFALHATTAYSAPGDPPIGSPAGSVYVLPLEQGRADAAPKGSGGTGAGGGSAGAAGGGASQPGETGSLYRSENNFGSSSRVPGLAAVGTGGGSSGGAGGAATGVPGSGAGGAGAGGAIIGGGAVAAQVSDAGNTSPVAGIALLVGIGGIAVAVGVFSRRKRA